MEESTSDEETGFRHYEDDKHNCNNCIHILFSLLVAVAGTGFQQNFLPRSDLRWKHTTLTSREGNVAMGEL